MKRSHEGHCDHTGFSSNQEADEIPEYSADSDEAYQEKRHFYAVIRAFARYKQDAEEEVVRAEKNYHSIQPRFQERLKAVGYEDKMKKRRECIEANARFFELLIQPSNLFENEDRTTDMIAALKEEIGAVSIDRDKVKSTLKQFVRDWSDEGKVERDQCYEPILRELEKLYPIPPQDRANFKVLVPGAGLGRLSYEIVSRGFSCQGNEFSYHMLIASNWVLNRACHSGTYGITLHPWIHQTMNVRRDEDMFRPVPIPDLIPNKVPEGAEFSMSGGDFLLVYADLSSWDCIVTCFFLDTAHNVAEYVERIYKILKKVVPGSTLDRCSIIMRTWPPM